MSKLVVGLWLIIISLIYPVSIFANGQNVVPCPNNTASFSQDTTVFSSDRNNGFKQCPDNDCYIENTEPGSGITVGFECWKTDSSGNAVGSGAGPAFTPTPQCDDNSQDPGKHCSTSAGKTCDPRTGGVGEGGILTAVGCIPTDPTALIQGILKVTLAGAGGIALLIMAISAIRIIISRGDAEALKGAQSQFYAALTGLLFIIFSVFLLKVIGVNILDIPGFS